MTTALILYSGTFMRYALAVQPKNYLLFMCHVVNGSAQATQGYRFLNFHYWGGKEKMAAAEASAPAVTPVVAPVPESAAKSEVQK